jgi:predicted AlkP superfamily phosphohydrolase/phosphomutase
LKALLACAALALAAASASAQPRRVLIVGLDGLEWNIVRPLAAAGRLPNLARMIAGGASGVMRVTPPLRSPSIWTTIATGAPSSEHGIEDFFVGERRVSSADRRAEALWESASASSRTVLVVGWLATWPAETVRGTIVSDQALNRFADGGRVSPADALGGVPAAAWDYRGEESAQRLKRFLPFRWEPDYARRYRADSAEFARHDLVARRLAWVYMRDESFARIAERLLARDRPDLTMIHLWGVDHVSHAFWRHAYGAATAQEKADFGGLIPAYYEYLDEVLGRLARAAGPDALVIALSDHGFEAWTPPPGDPHPFLSGNHEPNAFLALAGPGVKPARTLEGAVPLDIAPTVLRALDAAPPDGQKGRALLEAFEPGALPPARPARPALRRPPKSAPQRMSDAEIERLRALGYLR